MSAKNTYHHGDLHRALIEAALSLMTEKSAVSLSLREVARRAGVSHAAPYRHFADKEALLAAVAEEGFRVFGQCLAKASASVDDPLARLEAIGVAYVRYALAHPVHYRVMFGSYDVAASGEPALVEASQRSYQVLLDAIESAQAEAVVRSGDPRLLAMAAWSLTHGLAMLLLENCVSSSEGNRADVLVPAVINVMSTGLAL
ncbi:MAG: TetR/AcrR family transcriptional regulator [Cyanobacteria bacterium J06632_3]